MAKLIWIAQHPEEPDNMEVSFDQRDSDWIYPNNIDHEDVYVPYKQYVLIPIDED